MSLAWPIYDVNDFAAAFAAKDEFISLLTTLLHGKGYIMRPNDDYYVAPYCFMSTKALPRRSEAGYLIFSSMVPFMKRREHDLAHDRMKRDGHNNAPFVGTIEEFQKSLRLTERDIYTFTRDGCVPCQEDVSCDLEDTALRVICDLMQWRFPKNWRRVRDEQYGYVFGPVLDLADYDNDKRRQQNQNQHYCLDRKVYRPNDNDANKKKICDDEEKEEKTTAFDYHSTPDKNGGFFEQNGDIFGNTFISSYNTVDDDDDLYGI